MKKWARVEISRSLWCGLALLCAALLAGCSSQPLEVVVYTGKDFELYPVGLGAPTLISITHSVGSFSIAPNGEFLVYASEEGQARMGHVHRIDLKNQESRQLTGQSFWIRAEENRESTPNEQPEFMITAKERYSDVAISPDSRFVVFAVHGVTDSDGDDLIGLSGPLAILDLATDGKRIVQSTLNVDKFGPAYANNPAWSADGRRLLMAFEVGGAISDVGGASLKNIDPRMSKPFEDGPTSPIAWLSDYEVFFVWNSSNISGIGKLFALNLLNGSVRNAADILHIPAASLEDVVGVDMNVRYTLIRHLDRSELFTRTGVRLRSWPTQKVRLRLFH